MELEQTEVESGTKLDGEVKNYRNEAYYEEDSQPELIKQNGMSDHLEANKENDKAEDELAQTENVISNEKDMMKNSNNGEVVVDEAGKSKDSDGKYCVEKELSESAKSDCDDDFAIDGNLTNTEQCELETEECAQEHEVKPNEDNDESQDSIDMADDEENDLDNKNTDIGAMEMDKSSVSKQLEVESEDSSKDSTDSSISNNSKASSLGMKLGDNEDSVVDRSNDSSDVPDLVKKSDEKTQEDQTDSSGTSNLVSENINRKDDEKEDNFVSDNNLKEKVAENGEKESVSDKSDHEKEVADENKLATSETKETLEHNSSSNETPKAGNSSGVQQPTVPYIVSSVPYVIPQSQLTVHQQQTGYITRVGNQHIFVPMSGAGAGFPAISASQQIIAGPQGKLPIPPKPTVPAAVSTEKPPDLSPKSSLEMLELMKWEIQNRVPDNYNWSVAFHPKKEELSSVTSFLLELGHDVVKEAVYKDIILIQTKKKEQGKLKESEIESLEKMKTVYENTKKKVEHLDMKMLHCKPCKFQTESKVVMDHHKDHPHIEPPWDWNNGWLCCASCDFRTKQTAAFSFHLEAVHNAVAKMPEKPGQFPCEMCPLDLSTNNKLTKHRLKCMKTFKLNVNLQPYYHDVNFCMKTCYYKPKRSVPRPAAKKPEQPRLQPQRANVQLATKTAAQAARAINPSQIGRQAQMLGMRQNLMQPQFSARTPPPLQRHPLTPVIRPQAAVPQANRPPVVRQMIQQKQSTPPGTPPLRPQSREMSGFEVCELCGGYVKDRQALRIHFYYAHKVEMPQTIFNRPAPPLTCDICQSKFWTTQGLSKHKSTLRHYATSANSPRTATTAASNQKCFMCNRMVPNLFVHVEQSHGMSMKELVAMKKCIMCGITAVDRRQLEVHMSSTHGVLIKASDFLGPDKSLLLANKTPGTAQPKPVTAAAAAAAAAATANKGKSMVRNNLCVFCQIQFADNIQLTMHCIKIHATCSACGMVVASSKHLQNHHCKKMMRDCVICGLKKLAPDAYADHIKKHVKPCSVSVDKMSDQNVKTTKEDIKKNYKPAVISLDSDSGGESDVELVNDKGENKSKKASGEGKKKLRKKQNEDDQKEMEDNEDDVENEGNSSETKDDDVEEDSELRSDTVAKSDDTENDHHDCEGEEGKDIKGTESNRDESEKANIESGHSRDDKNDSSKASLDGDEKSDQASKINLDHIESRKRKNDSSDESDLEEPKRQKTTADSVSDMSTENNEANLCNALSDNDSRDINVESQHASGEKSVDKMTLSKRPLEDDEANESGADSGTESDQANKRRKTVDDSH